MLDPHARFMQDPMFAQRVRSTAQLLARERLLSGIPNDMSIALVLDAYDHVFHLPPDPEEVARERAQLEMLAPDLADVRPLSPWSRGDIGAR